jgi:hypothetical protein
MLMHPFGRNAMPADRRRWVLVQRAGVALLLGVVVAFAVMSAASATGPADGTIVSGAIQTVGTVTAGTPFSSGQEVDVVIPANSVFTSNENINVVECTALMSNGGIPTDPSTCDGNTINGGTIKPDSSGAITASYQLFSLPNSGLGEGSIGPACNLAVACILYIGTAQGDFTQPHVWSPVFYINPTAGNTGANPGDGSAPPTPASASASVSTVAASPLTPGADGVDISTVTVTLLGSGNVPVAGKSVILAASSTTAKVSAPATSNAEGVASFTVSDTVAEPVTLTATDTTDNVTVTQTAKVTFQTPAINATSSSVSASPTAVPTPGATTTITVTLRDQAASPQPLANKVVTLGGTGSAVITPAATPNTTNASGVATFTATDTAAEVVEFTATDQTDNVVLSQKAAVTFGTLVVSPTASTVTASSPVQAGGTGTSAVVTLMTAGGSPVAGKTVTLTASSSTATVGPPAVTDANGQATFSVNDTAVESVTLNAVDTTDSLPLSGTATVLFQTSAPSSTQSTISSSTTTSPADGQTQTPINVVIRDQFGNPLPGKTVTLAATPSGSVQFHPISTGPTTPGVTDATGTAQFEADDTTAEVVTFTATDTTDNIPVSGSLMVTYTAGDADANLSTITSSPSQVPADGATPATITVTVADHFGNPVAGKSVSLAALNGNSVITNVSPTTGANGQATFSVVDATQEIVTYAVTDTTDSLPLNGQAVITFGNPPAPPPVPAASAIVTNSSSVPADGATSAIITVLLYDANANPVAGKAVTLTAANGSSKITAVSATTGNTGTATFAVTDSTVEAVTYTATDTTDNVSLDPQDVVVNFTAASLSAAAASGSTTSTTTTTTAPAAATTTTAPTSGGTTAAAASAGTDDSSSDSGASASLAFTGLPTLLPWLIGLGALLMLIGTLGRRIALGRAK